MTTLEGTITLGIADPEVEGGVRTAQPDDFKDTAKLTELQSALSTALAAVQTAVEAVGADLPASPETGLAKDTTLAQVRDRLPAAGDSLLTDPRIPGTWGYAAGASGTPDLTGQQVLAISATAGGGGGSIVIDGGDTITLAAGQAFDVPLRGVLVAPTIVFTGTTVFFVETVAV